MGVYGKPPTAPVGGKNLPKPGQGKAVGSGTTNKEGV